MSNIRITADCIDDGKKYLGITPYGGDTNYIKGDSLFWTDCQRKHGHAMWGGVIVQLQKAMLEGDKAVESEIQLLKLTDVVDFPELRTEAEALTDNFLLRLQELETLNRQLAELKEKELALRKEIFEACFAEPKEGTNTFKLRAGYVLKFQHKINRTLDAAALPTVREMLEPLGVGLDSIIRMKPELSVTEYKKLPEEARKVMDLAITAKPGTPSYEIVLPKR